MTVAMAKQRIFISYDYDHDQDIKMLLVGQSKYPDSPFEFQDASVKEHLPGDWKAKVRMRISRCDQVMVLCGHHTHTATGVAVELAIAREIEKRYFLLAGRRDGKSKKPTTATHSDKMYKWTWENLKRLIGGAR